MFYDLFRELCKRKGVSDNKACLEIGVSRTAVAKWKNGSTPNGKTLSCIADYFDVTTDYLLTGEETEKTADQKADDLSFDDFTYAMYGESKALTEEDKALLLSMAKQLKEARKKRN